MGEGDFTKSKKKNSSLTLMELAILCTKHLPTGQNYSVCPKRVWGQEPAILPYRQVHGDDSREPCYMLLQAGGPPTSARLGATWKHLTVISNKPYKIDPSQSQTKFRMSLGMGEREEYKQISKEQRVLHMVLY